MKISIIIPVMNKLHYTDQCLKDLFETINEKAEVIIVDNDSKDGTKEYLSHLKRISVISNDKNKGCAASWNQGIRKSRGEWIVILNNDVRLPSGWLDNLMHTAASKQVDVISPGMREGVLDYDIAKYAKAYTKRMRNAFRYWTPSGVCFAVRQSVFEKVGLFDENFHIGQYEDADFFRRCKNAHFQMGITGASFIHHFGSTTQKHIQLNSDQDYSKSNKLYHRKKWKIGFINRHYERYREQLLVLYWSRMEYFLYKHSLLEKVDCNKIRYF